MQGAKAGPPQAASGRHEDHADSTSAHPPRRLDHARARPRGRRLPVQPGQGRASQLIDTEPSRALLSLYQRVLGHELEWLGGVVHAERPKQVPVAPARREASDLLARSRGPVWLVCALLYGGGLRLLEAPRLPVKDIDWNSTRSSSVGARAQRTAEPSCPIPRWSRYARTWPR